MKNGVKQATDCKLHQPSWDTDVMLRFSSSKNSICENGTPVVSWNLEQQTELHPNSQDVTFISLMKERKKVKSFRNLLSC